MEEFSRCRDEMREASHRMDASGFKYRLSSTAGSECIEVSEEQEPQRELELDSEKPLEGVAGRLTIRAGNLRIAVTGKEDVARHKDRIEEARRRLADLRARFSAVDDSALAALANEREQLQSSLRAAQATLERTLSGKTLDELRQAKADLEHRRRENNVSEEDRAACAGRYLAAPAVLEKEAAKLEEAWKQAKRRADDLLASQRSDAALQQLETDLNAARLQAETADQQFLNADSMGRQPTSDFLTDLRQEVAHFRNEQRIAMPQLEKARESATRLAEAIKHSAPVRSLSAIEAELAEAQAALYREEVLQEARQLLAQRIDQTMVEMAAAVPEDLASRISSHLAELSEGALARVRLDADLKVTSVTQETGIAEHWTPEQLSVGQRTLAALTLKIAVARAIAETQRQPVFIILDDSLVNLDPEHRTATERLLGELAADGQLQVILLTCHTDWARAWQQRAPDCVRTIELQETADYYRQPLAATVN
jgi:ABC-type polar amino acid transport system ATPase subunit